MAPKEMTTAELYGEPAHAPLAPSTATCSPLRKKPATAAVRNSPSKAATSTVTPGKKRVRWATITIHEFGVGLGGSSVPTKGGPAIGLADAPEFTWTTKVGHMAERSEGVRRFNPEERVRLLQAAGESDGMILRFSRETNIILASRRRSLAEDDDLEAQRKQAKKRKAEMLERQPCAPSTFLSQRPRMVPASYV
ncbi:hypothetical protein Gpo141_00007441 [Globisporangium polare]